MNFHEHIQKFEKVAKDCAREICAFKKLFITHHQRSKNKVYNIYFPYFDPFPCEIFLHKHTFFFAIQHF